VSVKFDLTKLEVDGFEHHTTPEGEDGMLIRWSCPGCGFGELTVVKHPNGQIEVDTEAMSSEFVDAVIDKLSKGVGLTGQYVDRWAMR
jgi:hypothetical protein